jgi:putative NIF3 family GTP cyclohydrolase 1 type 2
LLVVSYHPTIFKPLSSITLSNPLQASLLTCAANGISVYSPHTACDAVWGGVNDWLADGVRAGQEQVQIDILGQRKVDTNGVEEGGEGRVVRLNHPIEMSELEARIKKHLKLSQSKSDTSVSRHFDQLNLAGSPSRIFSSII